MTKVFLSPLLLEYRKAITHLASQSFQYRHIAGVKTYVGKDPFPPQVHLLPPPRIELIDLTEYEGHVDDLILFATSDDFGIGSAHVIIQDERGNVIESGDAVPWPDDPGLWDYLTIASVPSGSSVIVSVTTTDQLGAVGALSQRITIP